MLNTTNLIKKTAGRLGLVRQSLKEDGKLKLIVNRLSVGEREIMEESLINDASRRLNDEAMIS